MREIPDRRESSTVFEEGWVTWKKGRVKGRKKKVWTLADIWIDQVHLLKSSDEVVLHVSIKRRCEGGGRKVSGNEVTNLDERQLLESSHRNVVIFQLQIVEHGIGEKSVRGGSDFVVDGRGIVVVVVEVVVTKVGEDTSEGGITVREKRRIGVARDASMLHHVSSINERNLTLIISSGNVAKASRPWYGGPLVFLMISRLDIGATQWILYTSSLVHNIRRS
jgi:hypothetical protein